ncbi:unnamed protein product [Mytilus coruscus]|uniref:DUF6570 domain-containing protein n=1 Tax=Mytilus coruscus TaxID=42192 RepID=A0A6J8EMQ1_MYTCO|nr:unnamed protein product [Mytilus coruscus]
MKNLSVLCSFLRDLACSLSSSSLEQIEYEMIRVEVKTSVNARNENFIVFNINVGNQDSGRSSENKSSKELSTLQVTSSSEVLNQRKHVPSSCITKHKDQVTTKIDRLNKKRKQTLSCHTVASKCRKLDDVALTNNLVKKFSLSVLEGPLYVCSSCSQTWFKEGVVRMSTVKSRFELLEKCTSGIKSVNNIEWVCLTCKRYLESQKIPECSIGNNMKFPPIPAELVGLTNIEQRLISPRLTFMTIRQQPRGGQLCMKGNIVNVPADVNKTIRILPRTLDNAETIYVKLKRKISFKHSIAQEMIRPNRVIDAVKLLTSKTLFKSEDSDSWNEEQNHENQPSGNLDTMLNPVGFREYKQVVSIAPGEDKHVTCAKDEAIPDLINYQTHRHARTCRKKGKSVCRFNFPIPPMRKTTLLQPLNSETGHDLEFISVCQKNCVKIFDTLEEMKYGNEISFEEFLKELNLTDLEYCNAIRSSLKRAKLFLKRHLSEIRINSYNSIMLKCWQANIDVQFVLDPYSCASYIVSYISKGQRGMSNLMYEASLEAKENNMDLTSIRHISNKFLTHVEVSAQEAAYFVLQLPMRRSTRSFLFLNTGPPSERITLLKSVTKLEEMANYASCYDVTYPKKKKSGSADKINSMKELPEEHENDCLDDDPQSEDVEHEDQQEDVSSILQDSTNYMLNCNVKEICMSDGGILKRRKTQKILKYVRFNKDHDTEKILPRIDNVIPSVGK